MQFFEGKDNYNGPTDKGLDNSIENHVYTVYYTHIDGYTV
jgi:hypothetical protein